MSERDLILKTRAGDRDAFSELVRTHQRRVFCVVYRLLRNYEDAAEITQDAFICAYQAIKGFRLRCSFYTWIYRIALNLSYRRLRSAEYRIKLKTKSLDEPAEGENSQISQATVASPPGNPYQELLTKEQAALIYQGLATLPRKFYQAIVLRDLEGLSYKEIAQVQHCSLGTVMSRLYRARLKLSKTLSHLRGV